MLSGESTLGEGVALWFNDPQTADQSDKRCL